MNDSTQLLASIQQSLPEEWQEAILTLADTTLQATSPLRLIMVGTFSVGKSSLLNMLLQHSFLQTALEESTALPTFIEYGPEVDMQLIGPDGSALPLDENDFAQFTTQAPEGAACAILRLPQTWLNGISIIDLPGLGSVSASHREYTLAQVRQADAVLYLINPTGPTQNDLEMLKFIHTSGKRIKIIVTKWDEVEAAVERGEKAPSLEQWAVQIQTNTHLKVRLEPADRNGLGREEIFDFLQRAKNDLQMIRQRRFQAELKPILENALGQNTELQRSCMVTSEEASKTLHETLLQRKEQLIDFKTKLYTEQQRDREYIQQQSNQFLQKQRTLLDSNLQENAKHVTQEKEWLTFQQEGCEHLRTSVHQVAQELNRLSDQYGKISIPTVQIAEFNLRLPEPEAVSVDDFLNMGQLTQLQQALESQQNELGKLQQKMDTLAVQNMSESEETLHALIQQRHAIASQPLPTTVERVNNGQGASIGRFLGEVADIGLMFFNPTAVGTKVAALAGKGAKLANVAVKTSKIAKGVKTGVKAIQAAKMGQSITPSPVSPIINKLGSLEMLSLGYWGERLGSMIGGGPVEVTRVDPQAVAEQQAALAQLDAQTQQLRRALSRNEDIANERQLTGWALEQNQKEQSRLQTDLQKLKLQAEQKHREAQQQQQEERQRQLQYQVERAVNHWLRSFDQQTGAMNDLMYTQVKTHWENRVDGLINQRLQEIEQLNEQAQASAEEKREMLVSLRQQAEAIERTLAVLR